MLKTGTAEAEPVTAMTKRGVMQDMVETSPGVKAGPVTMKTGLIWPMLESGMAITVPGTAKTKFIRPNTEKRCEAISSSI